MSDDLGMPKKVSYPNSRTLSVRFLSKFFFSYLRLVQPIRCAYTYTHCRFNSNV